ncbi:MAG: alternative ribosome rescue aminoacyl-tRNA hydrolase ArfB [Acidobacteria bacterium]|nr:alternative ribosome rescue aminoacyl-tRNA hydrolase ArfB [Acidobacteriota bacterium]
MATLSIGGLEIPETALAFKFVRASGPGGQNVNKVATAVQCRLDLDAAGIEGVLRRRLEHLAGKRLTGAGEIVVFAATHRTQARNRAEALSRLAAMIEEARAEPRPRRPTGPSVRARAKRLADKRRRGVTKKRRGRVDAGDEAL